MPQILDKLTHSFRKNKLEAIALITGQMPSFVYGVKGFRDIPVFCFHSARYPLFEKQLQFLNRNGYKTLSSDELHERLVDKRYKNNGKEIAITFDDGMASVWTVAYPLLQKYEQKIISFILPGLTRDDVAVGATIDDVASDREKVDLANRDYGDKPLCNWREIEIMHESGLVDFQSHGMIHSLISTSPNVVDFIHPQYDVYHYGNINIPVYRNAEGLDSREYVPGHPVYENTPRLSGKPRYFDAFSIRQACAEYAVDQGGEEFFAQADWRKKLLGIVTDHNNKSKREPDNYESGDDVMAAMEEELVSSKRCIEERLNKEVPHFCFPWFIASSVSSALAAQLEYQDIHVGALPGFSENRSCGMPVVIKRIQEEYLLALPGSGRVTLLDVFKSKISKSH